VSDVPDDLTPAFLVDHFDSTLASTLTMAQYSPGRTCLNTKEPLGAASAVYASKGWLALINITLTSAGNWRLSELDTVPLTENVA
jgi:hypothetical protein